MKVFLLFFFILTLLTPMVAFAVPCGDIDDNGLNLCYPSFGGFSLHIDSDLNEVVAWIYYGIIGIAGIAAFIRIVYGGLRWMSSAGDPTATGDAKDIIKKVELGYLVYLNSTFN